jgi:hypothetical protein
MMSCTHGQQAVVVVVELQEELRRGLTVNMTVITRQRSRLTRAGTAAHPTNCERYVRSLLLYYCTLW